MMGVKDERCGRASLLPQGGVCLPMGSTRCLVAGCYSPVNRTTFPLTLRFRTSLRASAACSSG